MQVCKYNFLLIKMFCKAELCKTFLKTCGEKLGLQRFHRFPSIVLSTMQLCKFYFLLIKALLWKTCVSCVFESLCVYTKTFEGNTNTGAKHPKEKHLSARPLVPLCRSVFFFFSTLWKKRKTLGT